MPKWTPPQLYFCLFFFFLISEQPFSRVSLADSFCKKCFTDVFFDILFFLHLGMFSKNVHAIIASNHLLFFKIFSNFVYFCPLLTFFCPLLQFLWKIACLPSLSRIDPECFRQFAGQGLGNAFLVKLSVL